MADIKDQQTIEKELIQSFLANQDEVTFVGHGGVAKALFTSTAIQLGQLWYDYDITKRGLHVDTATGDALDVLGEARGVARLGESAASAILIFSGAIGTVIPNTSQFTSQSGIVFETTAEVTITVEGAASIPLADKVIATATTNGADGNVPAYTITTPASTITGLTATTNPLPASGGADEETDAAYRERIKNQISLLNQGTQAFYKAAAQDSNSDVLRSRAVKGSSPQEVDLTVAKRTGEDFSSGELAAIKSDVEDVGPVLATVNMYNVDFTDISIVISVTLKTGYTLWDVYNKMADDLANLLDWSSWTWGTDVDDADLLEICNGIEGVANIDLTVFSINGTIPGVGSDADVSVADDSLPRLYSIELTDTDGVYNPIGPDPFNTSYLE